MLYTPAKLHELVDECLLRDQHRFRRRIRSKPKPDTKPPATDSDGGTDSWTDKLLGDIERSKTAREQRAARLPAPNYPEELPVVSKRSDILDSIRNNQVTIVCGETGSGKTTQIPKICLEAGLGVRGYIGHTQPRRIAARSVAARIAEELGSDMGDLVGYRIRFNDLTSEHTLVKMMTDGVLLAEIQSDPWLNQYEAIIIDEAHERSLNIDFLLGYLKRLLVKRRDLKVIITSATIDPDRFSKHFDNAPVIFAEGRSYPVEVRWQPLQTDDETDEQELADAVIDACEMLIGEQAGDVLVFLTGERDIREVADALSKHARQSRVLRNAEILPLFSRLSNSEQNRIFQRGRNPRIVLATNVAETSLTVPGIRSVVDAGTARISRYSVRSKVQRLPVERVSQASADQRKGRCGREAPGICVRLYDEEDFSTRAEFTEPEILRTNLAAVILQMSSMRLGAVEDFPFVEPPEHRFVSDGYRTLQELAALDESRKLTPLGKQMARLAVDPRLGRMLLAAQEENCLTELLTIVSALSVQDPRDRPFEKRQAADELHAEFSDEKSDFIAWLNLWSFVQIQKKALSNSRFRKMCKQRYLSPMRLREWMEVRRQLQEQCKTLGMKQNSTEASHDHIHRALLSGLLSNVAVSTDKEEYLGTRNRKLSIFPGSALFRKKPKWIIAAEVSETTRLYARQVAGVSVEWIERQAEHLLQYHYRDPHWRRKQGIVSAWQQSTLYGLIINPKKRVHYAPLNPQVSREIFLREGLVEGQLITRGQFLQHNLELLEEVVNLEEKSRRRDIVVDPEELFRFYEERVPEDINSAAAFEKWRKQFEHKAPRALYFDRDMLVRDDAEDVSVVQFPEQLEFGGMVLPLKYHFSPGEDNDGVTLIAPAEVLNRISPEVCEWLVPGMRLEKFTQLIKSLPKSLRRNFVPAPDYAADCMAQLEPTQESITTELAKKLQQLGGVEVSQDDFDSSSLLPHLLMRYEVIDANGELLTTGRDLRSLQKQFAEHVEENLLRFSDSSIEKDSVTDWNFGDLADSVEVSKGGIVMRGHPALYCTETGVGIRLFSTADKAALAMRSGVRRLYKIVLKEEVRYLSRKLPNIDLLSLRFTPFGSKKLLIEDIIDASFDQIFISPRPFPRSREEFLACLEKGKSQLVPGATRICSDLEQIFEQHRLVAKRIEGSLSLSWIEAVGDIKDQIAGLIYAGFVSRTGARQLRRLPVYFQAMGRRLDSIDHAPDKDRRRRAELLPVWEKFKSLPANREESPGYNETRDALRWSFEELRISLFAQELGTDEKVSVSKLESRVNELVKMGHD